MIVFLEGTVEFLTESGICLNVHGVGYEVFVPQPQTFGLHETSRLFTYAVYREDNQQLYGFPTFEERNCFKLLVEKVNGVGPKLALTLLTAFKMSELCELLVRQDVAALSKCPGVGKKTAQRLVLELQGCLKKLPTTVTVDAPKKASVYDDAAAALTVLGYAPKQAEALTEKVRETFPDEVTVEGILKRALQSVKKGT